MSKKNKQMDLHFQKYNIKRFLKFHVIQPDAIDINSLIDTTLFYPENEKNISKQIGVSKYEFYKR